MYLTSRLLLILSTIALAYCLAILTALMWPGSGWVIGLLAAGFVIQRRLAPFTTLGSARWADEADLRRAGMLGANRGLILGRLRGGVGRNGKLRSLFSGSVSAKDACGEIWSPAARRSSQLVRLPRAIHTAVFAPSGGGKGVSLIIPFLLTCPESCVIIDFKGENAIKTALHRRKTFGHRIVLIDPYRVITQTPDTFNPLDFIDKDSSTALDD